nr:HAD hydrolase-like protein [Euryarchaeota archaeon]
MLYTRDEYSSDVYPENQFSVMVGDRKSDIIAGISHGVRTFYVQQEIGLLQVMERILDYSDSGDAIEKIGD